MSQQLLVKAAKLLDFGAKSIEAQNVDLPKLKGARSLFFQMIVAAHSYAEAVYILCKRNRTPACGGLLRSLLENLINIRFLYSAPREHHHIIFLHGVIEKRKQQNHALEFLNKNPQYQDQGFSITDLSKARDATVTQENVYTKKVNGHKMKLIESVIERTKYVDVSATTEKDPLGGHLKGPTWRSFKWTHLAVTEMDPPGGHSKRPTWRSPKRTHLAVI